jgi:hypothetical protein
MSNDKKIEALNTFLGEESIEETKNKTVKTVKKTSKSGEIVEHVEKKLVLEDGRQLLI